MGTPEIDRSETDPVGVGEPLWLRPVSVVVVVEVALPPCLGGKGEP